MADARVGQQGTLARLWARKGSRPPAPKDCRYAWALAIVLGPMADNGSFFGAVCPARADGAAVVMRLGPTRRR